MAEEEIKQLKDKLDAQQAEFDKYNRCLFQL